MSFTEEELVQNFRAQQDVDKPGKFYTEDDLIAMERSPEPDINEPLVDISPDQQREWESKGPIGGIETLRRQDKLELLPFIGSAQVARKTGKLLLAVNRLKDPETNADQRARDEETLKKYLTTLEEERIRKYSGWGKFASGVSQLPSFMLEFIATGPAASLGKAGVKKAAQSQIRKIVKNRAAKAALRVGGAASGAAARTAVNVPRLAAGFTERQIRASLELTDKGIQIADQVAESPFTSALKSFGDLWVENFSEVTGPALSKGAGYLMPRQVKSGLERLYKKMHPNKKVVQLWTKAGYNGFLEELGEERLGDFLRALTGIEDFGADNPENIWDRVVSSIPNSEEMLIEAGVLAVPGALRMSSSQMIEMIRRRKREAGAIEPELSEITDEKLDEIVTRPTGDKAAEPGTQDEAAQEAQITETAREAEETLLEGVPEDLSATLQQSGLEGEQVQEVLEDFSNRLERGQDPLQATQQILESQGIELPRDRVESLKLQFQRAIEPESESPTEAPADQTEEEILRGMDVAQAKQKGEPLPPQSSVVPTRQIQPESLETEDEKRKLAQDVFGPVKAPLPPSVTDNPNFVKMTKDAAAIVRKYAEQRGVAPTPKFARKLWQEFHDLMGTIRKAPPEQRASIAAQIMQDFPDISNEFITLRQKLQSDETEGMADLVVQRYGPTRPAIGISQERDEAARQAQTELEDEIISQGQVSPEAPQPKGKRRSGLAQSRGVKSIEILLSLKKLTRNISKTAKQAAKFTINDVRDAQERFIQLLEQSGMTREDKGRFLRAIKNINGVEQFRSSIDKIAERIDKVIDTSLKRKTIASIRKELKTTKPKIVSSALRGNFTPTIQEILSRMQKASRMTKDQAEKQRDENLGKNASGNIVIMDTETKYENMMLDFTANKETKTTQEFQGLLKIIKALKQGGRQIKKLKDFQELMDMQDIKNSWVSTIDSAPPDKIKTTIREDADDKKWGWFNRFNVHMMGWENLLNHISGADKSTKTNQSVINKHAGVFDEETSKKRGLRLRSKEIRRGWVDAFGPMTNGQIERTWAEDAVPHSLGTFTDQKGKQVEIVMSRAMARKRWMEFQDPTLNEVLFGQHENSMGWTQEMKRAVENSLTPEDLKWARFQLDFYQRYYNHFNEVYSEMTGVNLPKNPNYSPIRRIFEQTLENELLGEITYRQSLTPSAGKVRVKNFRALDQLNDVEVLQKHIAQVEHYRAWAKKIRKLNQLFGDERVRKAIRENWGQTLLTAIDRHIQDFTRGGIDRSNDVSWVNVLKNNYTVAVLSGKTAITIKQLMSFPAMADSIPTSEFIKGMIDLGKGRTSKKVKILASSELMRSRGLSITPEMAEAVNTREWANFQLSPTLRNFLLTMTRWGDRGAIYLGGWPVYRYHREVLGKPHSEAIKEFEKAVNSSQQSADLSQQSWFQRGNSFQRLFSVFLSAPNQYYRKEVVAIQDYMRGRISAKEAAKTVAIYHFILPMMFQWAMDGGDFRGKEQLRAGILGSLNGLFIIGDILDGMASIALDLKVWQSDTILQSLTRELFRFMRSLKEEDIGAEEFWDIIKNGLKVAGMARGLPAQQAINVIEGIHQMADAQDGSDMLKGFKRIAGWSEFYVNQGDAASGDF